MSTKPQKDSELDPKAQKETYLDLNELVKEFGLDELDRKRLAGEAVRIGKAKALLDARKAVDRVIRSYRTDETLKTVSVRARTGENRTPDQLVLNVGGLELRICVPAEIKKAGDGVTLELFDAKRQRVEGRDITLELQKAAQDERASLNFFGTLIEGLRQHGPDRG